MRIRPFLPSDYSRGMAECLAALSGGRERILPDFVATWHAARVKAGVHTFVALNDNEDKVVGTAALILEPKFLHGGSWVGHVEDVAVHPSGRGRGVGRALVQHLVDICDEEGCYKVILNCHARLVPFYEKMGFLIHDHEMRLDLK